MRGQSAGTWSPVYRSGSWSRTHAGESPATTHIQPLYIDYHGGEDHSLPCAFYESGNVVLSLLVCAAAALLISCQPRKWHGDQKLIILGIDGMDPQLLKKFMAEGKMPNFSALAQKGSFRLLTTSIPPQSPVAWSNLITGMNAGGHGIFDFIHRDPKTLQPYFSASRVEPPKHGIHLGNWVIPIWQAARAEQLRQGKAFWETLDDYGVPNTIFRMPSNFPPVKAKGPLCPAWARPICAAATAHFPFIPMTR